MFLAIGNGFVREATYGQLLPELYSHQLSTAVAMVVFALVLVPLSKYSLPDSSAQAVAIGLVWLALTVCFEFSFGRFVVGHSWERLFQDYNVLSGRVWPVLLLWISCLPYIAYRYRKSPG